MGAASEVIDVSYYATVRKGQDVLFSGFVGRGQMEVGSFLGSSPIGTEANITATISPQQAASLASSGDYRSYLSSQLGLGGSRWVDTGTSSVSGYSEAWDGTNVSISMTVTGTTSGFFENDDQQKLEEKKAAATVASGVEAALQVL